MPCPSIATGTQFLTGVMTHIDCQARNIGSYGYGALANPNSAAFHALAGLLAIFVAFHGISLLFDGEDYPRRLVRDIVKVGIVLTLATSWPAWRVVGFDLVMSGPSEVAQVVGLASGTTTSGEVPFSQVQSLDDAMVVMTAYGSGRYAGGGVPAGGEPGDSFQGIALADQFGLGLGRSAFLVGTIVPFGIARLGAGLLLAITPLIAGLYLFGATAAIFIGWVRGLIFCAVASFAQNMVQGIETGLALPWVQYVIAARQEAVLTPSAPTELFVMSLSFAFMSIGVMLVLIKLAFFPGAAVPLLARRSEARLAPSPREDFRVAPRSEQIMLTRAQIVAESVSNSMRHEQLLPSRTGLMSNGVRDVPQSLSGTAEREAGGGTLASNEVARTPRRNQQSTASGRQRDRR